MALDAQKPWPADKVERWPVEKLIPYARNSRTHTPAQISQIAGSIKEWGFTVPVLAAEDGTIIAGHARTQAAQKLGLTEIPVMVARGWTEAQKRAYVIADNKLTLNAEWDQDLLVMELSDALSDGFDITLTGFNQDELNLLIHGPDEAGAGDDASPKASLADRFGIPPFSVLNAREGWWQDRKRAWIGLGIQSELGRGENLSSMEGAIERREAIKSKPPNATPGGSMMPAANYSKSGARGDGRGRPSGV